jgi:hypothetical protein
MNDRLHSKNQKGEKKREMPIRYCAETAVRERERDGEMTDKSN